MGHDRASIKFLGVNPNQVEGIAHWAAKFNPSIVINRNGFGNQLPNTLLSVKAPLEEYDCIVAILAKRHKHAGEVEISSAGDFIQSSEDYVFGHLNYDLKNQFEALVSKNPDNLGFPIFYFFEPEVIILIKNTELTCLYHENEISKGLVVELKKILKSSKHGKGQQHPAHLTCRTNQEAYRGQFLSLQKHIQRGDIYEANYCIEHFDGDYRLDNPVCLYLNLIKLNPVPFACFYRLNSSYLLCASPERYLMKTGSTLLSQPMKGTIGKTMDKELDKKQKKMLLSSIKERSENIMITDLVRNDLSRIAEMGSVQVDELCGLYEFKHIHQLITTISCKLKEDIDFLNILKNTFPMGSMTGAPKLSALELIDKHEDFKRNIFSGSVGFITPLKDFDFNVVIRSIFYHARNNYLSLRAGSAITSRSDVEQEYKEINIKLDALRKLLKTH